MFKEGMLKIWQEFLDRVFPESCFNCGKVDVFLCIDCRAKAKVLQNPPGVWLCLMCKNETISGVVCELCAVKTPLNQLISLTEYKPKSIPGQLIESLKYGFSRSAASEIQNWLKKAPEIIAKLELVDVIIPIPLHPRRQAERGFNQADLIAQSLSQILQKPVNNRIVTRVKATKQQAKLNRADRIKNMDQAFVCVRPNEIKNKNCLLVDDVFTTGSTMSAVAKVLKNNGTKKVLGFTLARGL